MDIKLHESWKSVLSQEFDKPYFNQLTGFVNEEYKSEKCYPPGQQIYSAFDHCHFDDLKVVIIGQDPYHGQGQANGLCFSVGDGIAHPPSLRNIFKELEQDLDLSYPTSGNLESWAKQGVLLLNATLTVQENMAGSHQGKGWETFTDAVIEQVSSKKEDIVFLFWGGYAKKKGNKVDKSKHHILSSGHPSPLSANRGYWFGNKHFSQCNTYLESIGKSAINWQV